MNISKHITFEEATHSGKAVKLKIDNTPNAFQLNCMEVVAEKCFEPLRNWYGKPLKINSFFRSIAVNKAVGGKPNSQHLSGQAIDITAGSKEENKKLFEWCKDNLVYDQLINEYNFSWVHISYNALKNRQQIVVVK